MGDGHMPLEVEVDDGRIYTISAGDTLEECLIDLKERVKNIFKHYGSKFRTY